MDLHDYRRELDRLDNEITRLFAERMAVSAQVADYKREHGIRVLDVAREVSMFERVESQMPLVLTGYGTALYADVLALSRARQERSAGRDMENIVLIGMPGSGKKTIGRALSQRIGRPFLSSDRLIETLTGLMIPEIFARMGEDAFRALETQALALVCARSGCVIATGGGCVTRQENIPLLRMGGRIVWLRRETDALAREGRPLSLARDLNEMYAEREPLYRSCADAAVDNNGTIEQTVAQFLSDLEKGG